MRLLYLPYIALSFGLSSAVQAQVSSSSIAHQMIKPQIQSPIFDNGETRLFSEDGLQFRLRANGCEFAVDEPILGNSLFAQISRAAKQQSEGHREGKVIITYLTRLSNPMRINIINYNNNNLQCDDRILSNLSIMSVDNENSDFAIQVVQTPVFSDGSVGTVRSYAYYMKRDFFTPQQADRAWRLAGRIGMAVLEAYIKSRK